MILSSDQRRYLLVGHRIVPFAINFLINGIIGLLVFRGVDPVPTWGVESSAGLLSAAPPQLELAPFLWSKALFSAVLGGVVTPIIGVVALAEGERHVQASHL